MPAGGIFHGSMGSMAPEREQAAQGPSFRIRAMDSADADQVLAIYQAGLDTGNASFEIRAPTWEDFSRSKLSDHRIVAEDMVSRRVLGWAACIRVSDRGAYAGVVEHSVYVASAHQRQGLGRALLDALIASTEAAGIWTIQSSIFPENAASLHLHRQAGFRVVGTRRRIGKHGDRWRDVIMIERRSPDID